jgi:hypothetical protein
MGAEFFNTDRQTDGRTSRQKDLTKLMVAFWNFSNAPKKGWVDLNFCKSNSTSFIVRLKQFSLKTDDVAFLK